MQHMDQTPASCALHVRCYGALRGHTEWSPRMGLWRWQLATCKLTTGQSMTASLHADAVPAAVLDGLTVYLSENGRSSTLKQTGGRAEPTTCSYPLEQQQHRQVLLPALYLLAARFRYHR